MVQRNHSPAACQRLGLPDYEGAFLKVDLIPAEGANFVFAECGVESKGHNCFEQGILGARLYQGLLLFPGESFADVIMFPLELYVALGSSSLKTRQLPSFALCLLS